VKEFHLANAWQMQTKPAKPQNICNKSIIATTFQLRPHIASNAVQFTPNEFLLVLVFGILGIFRGNEGLSINFRMKCGHQRGGASKLN